MCVRVEDRATPEEEVGVGTEQDAGDFGDFALARRLALLLVRVKAS